jgi:hypothetical protein
MLTTWTNPVTFRGPVKGDRLWFFFSGRRNSPLSYTSNLFENKNTNNQDSWIYEPDLTKPAFLGNPLPMTGLATDLAGESQKQDSHLVIACDEPSAARSDGGGARRRLGQPPGGHRGELGDGPRHRAESAGELPEHHHVPREHRRRLDLGIRILTANYVVPNSKVRQSLGRDLSGGSANVTVSIVAPGSAYGDRLYQTDFRVGKIIRLPQNRRITASVDLFNLFNGNSVLQQNNSYSLTNTTLWAHRRSCGRQGC